MLDPAPNFHQLRYLHPFFIAIFKNLAGIFASLFSIFISIYDALHLIGEGRHCDPLPCAGDHRREAGGEVTGVQGATCHVSQEDGLQSHAVSQEGLAITL